VLLDKLSSRTKLVGLCIVAASVAAPSLLLNHGRPHLEDQAWSSRQRTSIASGAVGTQLPPKLESSSSEETNHKESDTSSASFAASDGTVLDQARPSDSLRREVKRYAASKLPPQQRPKSYRSTKSTGLTERKPADNSRAPNEEKLEQAQPVRDAHDTTTVLNDPSATSDLKPDTNHASSVQPGTAQPPQQPAASAVVTQPLLPAVSVGTSQSDPRPKTREEVKEELRNARANGALPKFGNPDPYGPGGSPSASGD
jgi:hypothetical protein